MLIIISAMSQPQPQQHQPSRSFLKQSHLEAALCIKRMILRRQYRGPLFLLFSTVLIAAMVLGLFPKRSSSSGSSAVVEAAVLSSNRAISLESRLRGALWGFFAGDALSMPTHWYYGGLPQIQRDYGRLGIQDYTAPVHNLPGSILNKSNVNGGGRGSYSTKGKSIIGDVINHGKHHLWDPALNVHYHATLKKGENTLEAQLARVLMKSIVDNGGIFQPDHFRQAYIQFMTTPDSHNDTYASTCHRMFFANLIFRKLDPKDCPDNDGHNVETVDGLVLPTISALASRDPETAAATAEVTRRSEVLVQASRVWGRLVSQALTQEDNTAFQSHVMEAATALGLRTKPSATSRDAMTACYLGQALPSTLDMVCKYTSNDNVWQGLLANANVGGENVHRGSILGAILGARAGEDALPINLKKGLHDYAELEQEIDSFVKAVIKR